MVAPGLTGFMDEVREAFGWSRPADHASAIRLRDEVEARHIDGWSRKARERRWESLCRQIADRRTVAVIGAAATIEEVSTLSMPMLVADGAYAAVRRSGVPAGQVLLLVSDGDGGLGLEEAIEDRVPMLLHAHGDNIDEWRGLLPRLEVVGLDLMLSHQLEQSVPGMVDMGGFTDGDRALAVARGCGIGPEAILSVGFRTDVVGRWSGITDPERKLVKLKWMAESMTRMGFRSQERIE